MTRWRLLGLLLGAALVGTLVFVVSGGSSSDGSALDLSEADGSGSGAPMEVGEDFVSNALTVSNRLDAAVLIEAVRPSGSIGAIEFVDYYLVAGTIGGPDWSGWLTMTSDEKVELLESRELEQLPPCDDGDCVSTIALVARRTGTGAGVITGFSISYSVAGQQYEQSVEHQVGICEPSSESCADDVLELAP